MLSKVLPIVWGSEKSRKKYFDLRFPNTKKFWVIMEAGGTSSCWGWRLEGKSISRRLISLLEILEWKKTKKVNIPLIIIGGDIIPSSFRVMDSPWAERLMPLKLFSKFQNLSVNKAPDELKGSGTLLLQERVRRTSW